MYVGKSRSTEYSDYDYYNKAYGDSVLWFCVDFFVIKSARNFPFMNSFGSFLLRDSELLSHNKYEERGFFLRFYRIALWSL